MGKYSSLFIVIYITIMVHMINIYLLSEGWERNVIHGVPINNIKYDMRHSLD